MLAAPAPQDEGTGVKSTLSETWVVRSRALARHLALARWRCSCAALRSPGAHRGRHDDQRPEEPRRSGRRRPRHGDQPRAAVDRRRELSAEAAGRAAPQDRRACSCGSGSTTTSGPTAFWRKPAAREISRGGPFYVDASRGIAVLELRGMSVGPGDGHAHGSGNPHYWLDPENAEIITATLLEAIGADRSGSRHRL